LFSVSLSISQIFPPNEKQLVYKYNKNVDMRLSAHDILFSHQMAYKFSPNTKVSSQWHIQLVYKNISSQFYIDCSALL
jgi:hypothetical protein